MEEKFNNKCSSILLINKKVKVKVTSPSHGVISWKQRFKIQANKSNYHEEKWEQEARPNKQVVKLSEISKETSPKLAIWETAMRRLHEIGKYVTTAHQWRVLQKVRQPQLHNSESQHISNITRIAEPKVQVETNSVRVQLRNSHKHRERRTMLANAWPK